MSADDIIRVFDHTAGWLCLAVFVAFIVLAQIGVFDRWDR